MKKVADYSHYFLGSIIVSKRAGKHYLVDGQQRVCREGPVFAGSLFPFVFSFRGRRLPYEPRKILPFFERLSPLPMGVRCQE